MVCSLFAEIHDVSIINMTFSPNSIQIAIGDTVRWTNLDSAPHTATATSGEWNSGNMNLNDEYSHVFLIEEVDPYYCIYHSNMTGSVTVGNPETEESQWELIESGINVPINDIFFVSETLGWCGSDMGILKTEDGGSNWNIYSTSDDVEAIYFINSTEGWACGNDGMILHTTNGGDTWVSQSSGTDEKLRDIRMADENNGWTVGRDGILFHTTNGGQNWVFQDNPAPDDLRGIAIESASTVWVVGSDGIIIHTTNGGESWNIQSIGTDEIELESVFFLNDQIGWTCGETGTILKTTNGGNSWVYQNSGVAVELTDIYFVDSSLGWSVGSSGTILFTKDGGNNWETMNGGTYATLNSIYFLNNEIGYSAGSEGVIIKYSHSYLNIDTNEIPKFFNISSVYPNPFNPTTTIGYDISNISNVKISIYNINGQLVEILANKLHEPGTYNLIWNAQGYTSGVYFVKLIAEEFIATQKIMLIK
jgi:photosystem II stability/assembly factor-like uncharacterized protein